MRAPQVTAPGARPKFRIDPTAAPVQRAPPPAPLAAAPPPSPPASARAPAAKRWVVWAAVGVAVLLVGTAIAVFGFGVGGLVYPQKYLLADSERPNGVHFSDPEFASQDAPCERIANPCKITNEGLDTYGNFLPARPKEAWAQGLDSAGTDGAPIGIVAVKFSSSSDADASAARLKLAACSTSRQAGGAVLQDGDVIVLITARNAESRVYAKNAMNVLKGKAGGLKTLCATLG